MPNFGWANFSSWHFPYLVSLVAEKPQSSYHKNKNLPRLLSNRIGLRRPDLVLPRGRSLRRGQLSQGLDEAAAPPLHFDIGTVDRRRCFGFRPEPFHRTFGRTFLGSVFHRRPFLVHYLKLPWQGLTFKELE